MKILEAVCLPVFILMLGLPGSAAASSGAAAIPSSEAASLAWVPPSETDFETYQETLDNLFRVGMLVHPDPQFGLHELILRLGRRYSSDPTDVEALIQLGHVYRLLGEPDQAHRFYEQALKRKPDDFYLLAFAGLAKIQISDFDAALERFERASNLKPKDAAVGHVLAALYVNLGLRHKALQKYEQVAQLKPKDKTVVIPLAGLYFQEGQVGKAVELLESFSDLMPPDPEVQYYQGLFLLATGQTAPGVRIWEALFQGGHREPDFLYYLALAYLDLKEYSKALRILEHLQFFLPKADDLDFLIAYAYQNLNRLEDAEARYRQLLALNPNHARAYEGLAYTLSLRGKFKESDQVMRDMRQFLTQAS